MMIAHFTGALVTSGLQMVHSDPPSLEISPLQAGEFSSLSLRVCSVEILCEVGTNTEML